MMKEELERVVCGVGVGVVRESWREWWMRAVLMGDLLATKKSMGRTW